MMIYNNQSIIRTKYDYVFDFLGYSKQIPILDLEAVQKSISLA